MVKDENLISIQYYLYYILSRWCWQYLKNIKKRAITVIVKNGVILQFFSSIRMAPFGSLRSKKKFFKNTFFLHWRITKLHFFWILEHYMIVGCSKFSISMTTKKGFKYITPNYTNKNIYSIIYYLQIYYILFQGTIRRVA